MDATPNTPIEKHLVGNEQAFFEQLCEDLDAEVRLNACESLRFFPYTQTEDRFLKLLHDPDELVQCQACEALASGRSEHVLNALIAACDNNGMLRGYAVISLADVQKRMNTNPDKTIAFLLELIDKEEDDWVRIAIYRSLLVLGVNSYIPDFLSHRKDDDYHNRCFLLNLLKEMLSAGVLQRTNDLRSILIEMYEIEVAVAVKDTIQSLLDDWK